MTSPRDLGVSAQSIYTWRRQDRIDRGLEPGLISADKAELVAARRRIAELETELEVAGRAMVELKEATPPKRPFAAIKVMAADALPVEVACRTLGVSVSGHDDWRTRSPSARAIRHAWLTDVIREVHNDSRATYGSRRVHTELTLGRGIAVGYHAVTMLMRSAGLERISGRPGQRPRLPPQFTAADLVDRQFARDDRNQLWVTDITEHTTREGKVYCAVVLDVFSRRVVGWSIDCTQTAALVTNALGMAIQTRRPDGTVIHSDQGVQFTSWALTERARASGLVPSMGSVGDCFDCDDQRRHGVVLVAAAGRVARPAALDHPRRAGQRPVRVPRDLPQPPAAPQRPWHAHPDRVRRPSPARRGMKSPATLLRATRGTSEPPGKPVRLTLPRLRVPVVGGPRLLLAVNRLAGCSRPRG